MYVNWFLPNKESIRGVRANPMHFHSLGELASEEPSESGRNVGMLHLRKPLPIRRRLYAPFLQRDRRRKQDLAGELCMRRRKVSPTALEAEGAKLAQRNLTAGQDSGSVISCGGTDRYLSLCSFSS